MTTTKKKTRRNYKRADGSKAPSVTELVKGNIGWGSQRLMAWANRVGREGLTTHKASKDARDAGTLCHDWLEDFVSGLEVDVTEKPDKVSETAWASAVRSYQHAMDLWRDERLWDRLEPELIEVQMIATDESFGGTPDLVCTLDGTLTVLDYKTGRSLNPEILLQLGGYCELLRDTRGLVVESVGVMHLPATGPGRLYLCHEAQFLRSLFADDIKRIEGIRVGLEKMAEDMFNYD